MLKNEFQLKLKVKIVLTEVATEISILKYYKIFRFLFGFQIVWYRPVKVNKTFKNALVAARTKEG